MPMMPLVMSQSTVPLAPNNDIVIQAILPQAVFIHLRKKQSASFLQTAVNRGLIMSANTFGTVNLTIQLL